MIKNLPYRLTGDNHKTYSGTSVVGLSVTGTFSITGNSITGDCETVPSVPVNGKPYTNIAVITPNELGPIVVKWVLNNNSYGFYGTKFVSESDLIQKTADTLNVSLDESEKIILKNFLAINPLLIKSGITYNTLLSHRAVLFEDAFVDFIYDTEVGLPSGDYQQVTQLKTDNEQTTFAKNTEIDYSTPLDVFLSKILPVLGLESEVECNVFSANGIRREEASLTNTEDGTIYPVPLQTYYPANNPFEGE